jgi:transcriptional regulator of acetoin/glycerol metabolism
VLLTDRERLHGTRDALRSGGLLGYDDLATQVRDPILRSWRRCVSADLPSAELRTRRIERAHASELLTRAAAPVLDRLGDDLADLGVAVILSNRAGRIISRRVADHRQQDHLDDNFVVEGFDYSEQTVGTNGLGTAIEEKRPVWVQGAEHFNDALEVFACVGVPILSPRGGSVAGSLSLAATASASNPMMMTLATFAARQVEQLLRETVYARETALAAAFSQRSRAHEAPAMLLTDDSVLSDTRLLPLMAPSNHVRLWEAVHQHHWTSDTTAFEISLGGSNVTVEARRIEDADGPAYLLHFPQSADAGSGFSASATASVGTPALAERSRSAQPVHAVPEMDVRLRAAAATADLLALDGPTGSGRLHVASKLALVTGRELLVVDAGVSADLPVDEWLPQAARAVAAGRCVVVRHAEQLPQESLAGVRSIVSAQARTTRQRGLFIMTVGRSVASAQFAALLDQFAVTVELPALAAMREVIPEIANEILATVEVNGGCPQLSSSALQALARWSWPGNVRELRSVLLTAACSARTAVIGTDDLPARVITAHRSTSLSGIERAERSAIMEALSRSRGNRSRAADELGIGRTTLYRKLRELKISNSGEWME